MFFDVYRDLCKSRNISPSAAAIEMGINKGTVSIWKNKGTVPQTPQLKKIADYFNVSVDYLLGNEEKPATPKDDEPDVKEALTDMAKRAAQGALLMYDGEPLDAETQRAFEASLRVVIATLEGRRGK